jgi:hypothetical protein
MPNEPVTVYAVDDGTPTMMHSVDAAEAVGLGDYTYTAPTAEPDEAKMTAARARFQGMNATLHPELMTPEERARTRAEANELAAQMPPVPPGASVVVMAGAPPAAAPTPAQAKRGSTPERS